MYPKKNITVSY